jgi:hypothetical protein
MTRNSSSERLSRPRTAEVAKLLYIKKNGVKFKLRVVPGSDDKSAAQLSMLEAENAELRRRAAELVLEIHTLRANAR